MMLQHCLLFLCFFTPTALPLGYMPFGIPRDSCVLRCCTARSSLRARLAAIAWRFLAFCHFLTKGTFLRMFLFCFLQLGPQPFASTATAFRSASTFARSHKVLSRDTAVSAIFTRTASSLPRSTSASCEELSLPSCRALARLPLRSPGKLLFGGSLPSFNFRHIR